MIEINAQSQPMQVFARCLEEARQTPGIREPTAMSVSSQGPDGQLHARVVLCKKWSPDGFEFFTNYRSRKGLDFERCDQAAAVFYWDPLFRQVNISGRVERTSREVSVAYWNSRAWESRLSQWLSHQSEPVGSRAELEAQWDAAAARFRGQEVPCPEHWGGYLLVPERIEFWFGQPNRLHDRFLFSKSQKAWTFRRLYP